MMQKSKMKAVAIAIAGIMVLTSVVSVMGAFLSF